MNVTFGWLLDMDRIGKNVLFSIFAQVGAYSVLSIIFRDVERLKFSDKNYL